jgi:VWFA-related protein
MTRIARCLSATPLLFVLSSAPAQQAPTSPSTSAATPQSTEPAGTLHTGTQLVIVDVVVQDRAGHPVHGLSQENFVLSEQKKPQTVRNFEEHSSVGAQKPGPPLPPMQPGVFTDYNPVPPDSTLNILLIDSLNTPMKDQMYVRQQLQDYVKHAKPDARIAIFGLTNRLILLQGFTQDPEILKAAVEHRLIARGSTLLDDPVGTEGDSTNLSDAMQDSGAGGMAGAAFQTALANVQQFEAEQQSFQTQLRTTYTLDAFNALAHYLINFPGRKNLIWFSGSFPLQIEPDPTLNDPFAVMADSNEEFRETTNLLAQAQAAVYPVDARGLMSPPMFSAANSGKKYVGNPQSFGRDLMKFDQSQADEHMTMDQMASDTGGHAYYNTNGLADAVAKALEAGANYYTLTYNPANHNRDGDYRDIRVELAGPAAAMGYKLAYRHGYYADDPGKPVKAPKHGQLPTNVASKPGVPTAAMLADHAAEAYGREAVDRGAPTPSDILFKVRVVPLTGKNDDTVAPGNQPDPKGTMKAPYRTFAVDYVALPRDFTMMPQSDGRHTGEIEFMTFVYDSDGLLLNVADKDIKVNFTAENYKQFVSQPVRVQLMISAPVKKESFLRVVIRDVPSNHFGAVEIPASEVGHLPPLQAQNTPPPTGSPAAAQAPAKPTGRQ